MGAAGNQRQRSQNDCKKFKGFHPVTVPNWTRPLTQNAQHSEKFRAGRSLRQRGAYAVDDKLHSERREQHAEQAREHDVTCHAEQFFDTRAE